MRELKRSIIRLAWPYNMFPKDVIFQLAIILSITQSGSQPMGCPKKEQALKSHKTNHIYLKNAHLIHILLKLHVYSIYKKCTG